METVTLLSCTLAALLCVSWTPQTQLPDEVLSAWAELDRRAALLQGTYVLEEARTHLGKGCSRRRVTKKATHDAILFEDHLVEVLEDGVETFISHRVDCINAKYSFSLERNKAGAPWKVTRVGTRAEAYPSIVRWLTAKPRANLLRTGGAISVPELIEDPQCVVKRFEECAGDPGFYLLELEAKAGKVSRQDLRARLHLDSRHGWVIRDAKGTLGPSEQFTQECEYTREPFPVPIRIVYTTTTPVNEDGAAVGSMVTRTRTFQYEYSHPSRLPSDHEFTLSAYGFLEPFGITWDRPTPWWLYALISAGVLFIVTVIVSFWKRRLAARSAG